jgi:CPA2 family monovalent cation:H+ antiporter-2
MYFHREFVHNPPMQTDAALFNNDILIILGAAGIVIPLLLRLGVNSIIGFLIVGLLLGPHLLGKLSTFVPVLAIFSLSEAHKASSVADLGVVFLLFLIGLELSFERLKTMRRLVFGFGALQVLLSTFALAWAASLFGFAARQSLVIGMALALSSTAIVIQLFSDEKRLGSQAGRISFSVLLMQDLAVIPMLLLVTALSKPDSSNLAAGIATALLQAAAAAILIIFFGRFVLKPIMRLVSSANSPDLFMAAVLFIAMGTGAVAAGAGLSMSLGAFIAGLVLAETEYRRAIETILEPFKGLLLGLFFLLVGLNLDLSLLLQTPFKILAIAALVIAIKTLIIMVLGRMFGLPSRSVLESALLLGPGGEFAFVLLASATAAGLFKVNETASTLLLVTLTMVAIPLLAKLAKRLRANLERRSPQQNTLKEPPPDVTEAHIIIAGFGRVGTLVADMLIEQTNDYLAIDRDVANVTRGRQAGYKVYFGDVSNPAFLETCGISKAKALAVTMDAPQQVEGIIKQVRQRYPDLKIIARARDERHAQRLYEAGATEAVPETIEASLQLAEALLVETGTPMGLAIAAVHERRDQSRKLLGRPNRREEVAKARRRLRANMAPKA